MLIRKHFTVKNIFAITDKSCFSLQLILMRKLHHWAARVFEWRANCHTKQLMEMAMHMNKHDSWSCVIKDMEFFTLVRIHELHQSYVHFFLFAVWIKIELVIDHYIWHLVKQKYYYISRKERIQRWERRWKINPTVGVFTVPLSSFLYFK
jgi:hypothetical protein